MAFDLGLTLFTEGGALTQAKQMEALLECNAATAAYGLQLTPAQVQALLDTRSGALRKTGRVELGGRDWRHISAAAFPCWRLIL